jgi:hypothetical protein
MPLISDPDGLSQGTENSVAATTFASSAGAATTITSVNVPVVVAGDFIEVRDATNAVNDGLYRVDTYNAAVSIVATKQHLNGSVVNPADDAGSVAIRIFGDTTDEKNVFFDTPNLLWTFLNGFGSVTVLDNAGVLGQAAYSFMKEEWRNDNDLIKFPFPMTAITPEQFEFNGWKPVDEAESSIVTTNASDTRKLLRTAGWDEVDANGFVEKSGFCWLTLGNIDGGDNAYSFFESATGSADIITAVFDGPVNEFVETITRVDLSGAGTIAFATSSTLTTTTGDFDADGFKVGDFVLLQNSEDPANDVSVEVTTVATLTLTVAGTPFTTNADDTTVIVSIDRRPTEFTTRIRVFGKTYDQSNTTAIGVTSLTNQVYRFPLSEAADPVITDLGVTVGDAGGGAAPWSDMTIAYFATGQSRSGFNDVGGDSGVTNFSVIVDGDVSIPQEDGGGVASAEQIYAFVQARLAGTTDINDGAGAAAVVVTGQLAEPLLLIASTGNTLSSIPLTDGTNPGGSAGEGVYVESFSSLDKNRVAFTDDDGDSRTFPLTVPITLNFNPNLVTDASALFRMFFTNDDIGDNLARDYGTIDAMIVQDDSPADIAAATSSAQLNYNYAYDGNIQRGAASAGTDAPVTIVAIGLSLAQYVVATGNITNTGLTASLVAALERNFNNP